MVVKYRLVEVGGAVGVTVVSIYGFGNGFALAIQFFCVNWSVDRKSIHEKAKQHAGVGSGILDPRVGSPGIGDRLLGDIAAKVSDRQTAST